MRALELEELSCYLSLIRRFVAQVLLLTASSKKVGYLYSRAPSLATRVREAQSIHPELIIIGCCWFGPLAVRHSLHGWTRLLMIGEREFSFM